MLYIWPFFAFFSLPLILPSLLPGIGWIYQALFGGKLAKASTATTGQPLATSGGPVKTKLALWAVYALGTTLISFMIVRYNTIIHPFTLADNRHYMFYIFKYTIRRAAWIRYALVLPYTVSRWMVWATLAGCFGGLYGFTGQRDCPAYLDQAEGSSIGNQSVPVNEKQETKGNPSARTKSVFSDSLGFSNQPVNTSTGLIFLLATALSLVTAPLVEPRYFIIPWVMWRLLIPAWQFHSHGEWGRGTGQQTTSGSLLQSLMNYDLRLVLETLWFILINAATGYIFLAKPYQWKADDGSLLDGGRLQRFMW
jgi:alpha-1,2-glucosyltransferase